jgi:splicing factor 3B subunit 3
MLVNSCFLGDAANNLVISSPLEAHKNKTIVFNTVAVDVDFMNPAFACIEVDYDPYDNPDERLDLNNLSKSLAYYELDLGVNHVTRKITENIDPSANMLIAVPSTENGGPGGIIICCEEKMIYHHFSKKIRKEVSFPRRKGLDTNQKFLIVAHSMLKQKSFFFYLLQNELGDLFKLTFVLDNKLTVTNLKLQYFDTVPVASSMTIFKAGFLYIASEFGNNLLLQFLNIGNVLFCVEYN